jgi:hypothetical protein
MGAVAVWWAGKPCLDNEISCRDGVSLPTRLFAGRHARHCLARTCGVEEERELAAKLIVSS